MTGAHHTMLRTLFATIGFAVVAPFARSAGAQGTVTVTLGATNVITSPGGAEIEGGSTATLNAKATVVACSHNPCTLFLKTSGAAVGPGTAPLEYCTTNCSVSTNWAAVPTSGNGALIGSVNGTASVDVPFQLRYRLTWTGTVPGSYQVPISITLKN